MIVRQSYKIAGLEHEDIGHNLFDRVHTDWGDRIPCYITRNALVWLSVDDTREYHRQVTERFNNELV